MWGIKVLPTGTQVRCPGIKLNLDPYFCFLIYTICEHNKMLNSWTKFTQIIPAFGAIYLMYTAGKKPMIFFFFKQSIIQIQKLQILQGDALKRKHCGIIKIGLLKTCIRSKQKFLFTEMGIGFSSVDSKCGIHISAFLYITQ